MDVYARAMHTASEVLTFRSGINSWKMGVFSSLPVAKLCVILQSDARIQSQTDYGHFNSWQHRGLLCGTEASAVLSGDKKQVRNGLNALALTSHFVVQGSLLK